MTFNYTAWLMADDTEVTQLKPNRIATDDPQILINV